ncbi:MAG: hypothetical protein KatS3mg076_2112 [Candidatus Binatia bacterium]|nr:MAG: hypothetical protein KatS3mg076_2112 [Candidatus Binatia bacterium]
MFELLLTRIFSAVLWYHFAFLAVSIALLGSAVGAVLVHLCPAVFAGQHACRAASLSAMGFSLSVVAGLALIFRMNVTFGASPEQLLGITVMQVLAALPFVFSGVFVCVVLLRASRGVGGVYGADLAGGAIGCALFVPFMDFVDGPRGALWLASAGAVGAALAGAAARDRRLVTIGFLLAVAYLAAFAGKWDKKALQVHWAKGHWSLDHEIERWNALSRLVVLDWTDLPFGWGLGTRIPPSARKDQKVLLIDGTAATILTRFDGKLDEVSYLLWDVTSLAYAIRRGGSVFVVGVGGGRDILAALSAGHRRVVGAEVNDEILDLLRHEYGTFTGHLELRPEVELVAEEARSYLVRRADRFDVIQASLTDTWAAAVSGAYVLSENSIYTREAFARFFDHLSSSGILSVSRWYLDTEPAETLRLLALAAAALRDRGVRNPREHLFLARSQAPRLAVATLLAKATPFQREELRQLRAWCADRGFRVMLEPALSESPLLAALAGPQEPVRAFRTYPLDLRPPTDDRPFFFHMLRMRDAFRADPARSDAVRANAEAVVSLVWLLVIAAALSGLLILLPLWGARGPSTPERSGARLLYFSSLGLGFIVLEIALMQRLVIALGHPTYGLTVVLFSLLLAAGSGSLWVQRASRKDFPSFFPARSLLLILCVGTATVGLTWGIREWLEVAGGVKRIAVSAALVAPLGFFLGIPLPAGLTVCAKDPAGYRALYWGANGAASVCGTVVATMSSLAFGITVTSFLGLGAYLVATLAALRAFPLGNRSPFPGRSRRGSGT